MMFVLVLVLFIVITIIFIYGAYKLIIDFNDASIVGIFLFIMFGVVYAMYLLLILEVPVKNEKVIVNEFQMVKTDNRTLIDIGNLYLITDKASLNNAEKENIELFIVEKYNIIGNKIDEELKSEIK